MCFEPVYNQIGGQFIRNIFRFNDGADNFNGGAGDFMMEHSNLTMEQLHHKTPYGDSCHIEKLPTTGI